MQQQQQQSEIEPSALSQLSELYGTRHESDLKEDINGLDKDEVLKVANILASKESYRPVAVN